jgi:hypothetical protein
MAGAFRRVPLWFIVCGLVLFLSGVALFIGTIDRCTGVALGAPPTAKIDPAGTLRLAGSINATLVGATRTAIEHAQSPIRKVDLDSYGGVETNMHELVDLLRSLDVVIAVGPGETCQSACVGLLAFAPGKILVAPTATLVFHSAALRVGLGTGGPCGWLNVVTIWIGRWFQSSTPEMLPWAERLSDRLPTLFNACRRNPLTTLGGMILSGAEFNGLRDGTIHPEELTNRCPPA